MDSMGFTSLNSDIMEKIGSYLLEDKNKTIQKQIMKIKMINYKYFCLVK